MDSKDEIYKLIPHRPPFLWVDRIVSLQADAIETQKEIPDDLEIFKGHYPDYPIMPGVLLCESVFQSGAILISHVLAGKNQKLAGVPVLSRITGAKFKRPVRPGAVIDVQVKITEVIGPAWFMKGSISVDGKTALKVNFACSLKDDGSKQ